MYARPLNRVRGVPSLRAPHAVPAPTQVGAAPAPVRDWLLPPVGGRLGVTPRLARMLAAADPLPPGSMVVGPLERGDQGISSSELPHAQRVTHALLQAQGVMWVVSYRVDLGCYEVVSRTGTLRFRRYRTPDGEIVFRIVELLGDNPVHNTDPRALRTFEQEVAAAGGVGKAVPDSLTSYPDAFRRISQLFDDRNAPDLTYVPFAGADPNHPTAGSHGVMDITQSRAPLIIAAPGVQAGTHRDVFVRHEDIAPTIAELLGVAKVQGTNMVGAQALQWLKWQDGRSLAPALVDARSGVAAVGAPGVGAVARARAPSLAGTARQAIMFVLDGASHTVLHDEIAKGNLPNIARIMKLGVTFDNGTLASYPTVTWSNHHSLLTGTTPGHHGILNNSWYDREHRWHMQITDGSWKNSVFNAGKVDAKVETLYEAVRRTWGAGAVTASLNNPAGRGATFATLEAAGFGMMLPQLPTLIWRYLRGRKVRDVTYGTEPEYRKSSRADNIGTALGETLLRRRKPPKFMAFEFVLPDSLGHLHGPHSPQARAAMREADRNIGRVLAELDRRRLTDSTALVVTADHGMEHQWATGTGGWFEALAGSGVRTVESTRFVYIRNVRAEVVAPPPTAGVPGTVVVRVIDDDPGPDGGPRPVAGATVTFTDAAGFPVHAKTDTDGVASLQVVPHAGAATITIKHADFTDELLAVTVKE